MCTQWYEQACGIIWIDYLKIAEKMYLQTLLSVIHILIFTGGVTILRYRHTNNLCDTVLVYINTSYRMHQFVPLKGLVNCC